MGMFIQIVGLIVIVGAAVYFFLKSQKADKAAHNQAMPSMGKNEKSQNEEFENSRV